MRIRVCTTSATTAMPSRARSRAKTAILLSALALSGFLLVPPDLGGVPTAEAHGHCQGSPTYFKDISTGATNGVQDAVGQSDDDWRVLSYPGFPSLNTPAHSIRKHNAWVQDGPTANWVNPWDQSVPYNSMNGGTFQAPETLTTNTPYVYAVDFHLDYTTYRDFSLHVNWSSDDYMVWKLNNVVIDTWAPPTSAWSALHQLDYAGGAFQPGWNRLEAHVGNWIIFTGLLVEGEIVGDCIPPTCTTSSILSTGVDAGGVPTANGVQDIRWRLVSFPGNAAGGPAYAAQEITGTWAVTPNAKWIAHYNAGNSYPTGPAGDYVYEMTFDVPCLPADCSKASLDMQYTADNRVSVLLNGVQLASQQGGTTFRSLHPLNQTGCANLVVGSNVLRAVVSNDGSYTGLFVDGRFSVQ